MITVKQILEEIILDGKEVSSNQIWGTCPYCNIKKFYINKYTGLWDCKAGTGCRERGNIYKLLRHVDKLHLLDGDKLDLTKVEKRLNESVTDEEEEGLSALKKFHIPIFTELLHWDDNSLHSIYLKKRGFTETDFDLYQPMRNDFFEKYKEYVLISIIQNYITAGFVGRYIYESADEDFNVDKKKYENSKGIKSSQMIFGLDEINSNTKTLIQVEGIFDKTSVTNKLSLHEKDSIKCVGMFGKHFSDYQIKLIRKYTNVENIVFMFDSRDAVREIKECGIKAKQYFNVHACYAKTYKDPNNMEGDEILHLLHNSLPIEQFYSSKVQFDILKN